jgi:23S rRNA (pseudouridine1915-N3)-methyltransferase
MQRMPPEMRIVLREIRPEARPAGRAGAALTQRILQAEADRIRAARPQNSVMIVLDERGQALSTRSLADAVESWRQDGRDVAFVIGGADGVEDQLKRSAQLMLSLSAMTLPHQLVRVLLVEQIYRAVSILSNHPYHRA